MEKRVLLAVFLSFLVLFVYQSLFAPPPPQERPSPGAAMPPTTASPGQSPAVAAAPVAGREIPPAEEEPQVDAPETLTADTERRDIVVETTGVRAVFSNQGAELRSWRLKGYLDQNGEPLELVPADVPRDLGRPFDLQLDDPALTRRLSEALFEPSATGLNLEGGRPGTLTFEYRDAAGLHARKTFAFDPGTSPFLVTFTATVANGAETLNPTIVWGPGIGDGRNISGRSFYQPARAILFRDGKVARLDTGDLETEPRYEGTFPFAGVEDHYFLSAEVSERRKTLEFTPLTFPGPAGASNGEQHLVAYTLRYAEAPAEGKFFFGPKDFDVLHTI